MGKPIVSIVIPFHNAGDFIGICLESIARQTIGIENLQLILVDDASTDSSLNDVREFEKKYANSVEIIRNKVSQGAAAARNYGAKRAKGRYIAFVDADDFLDKDVYEHSVDLLKTEDVDLVMYPHVYVDESGKDIDEQHNPGYTIFDISQRIDRSEVAHYPQLAYNCSVVTKVFRRSFFDKLGGFPVGRRVAEDALLSNMAFAYMRSMYVTNRVHYRYRKHQAASSSVMDTQFSLNSNFHDHLSTNVDLCDLKVKFPELSFTLDWFNVLSSHGYAARLLSGRIPSGEHSDSVLYKQLKKIYRGIDPSNLTEPATEEHAKVVHLVQSASDFTSARSKYRLLRLQRRIALLGAAKGYLALLRKSFLTKGRSLREVLDILHYRLFSRVGGPGDVWLFCERGDEARDNAYWFFDYVVKNYPEKSAFFVVDRSSPDRAKIPKSRVVDHGSHMHKKLFMRASKLISTHTRGGIEPWRAGILKKVAGGLYEKKDYIFLQHGVIYSDLSMVLDQNSGTAGKIDVFITSAEAERQYVIKHFNRPEATVYRTGLARWDTLLKSTAQFSDKTIVLMPTWRQYSMQSLWALRNEGRTVKDGVFLESEYYRNFQSFINNNKLDKFLSGNNYRLIFYPHKEVQQYNKYFFSPSSRIEIANEEDYDVQQLLKKSHLLVTDYSSVFFDFALLKKPLIYFQFDASEYHKRHSRPGYFDFKRDGFGPIASEPKDLVGEILRAHRHGLSVEPKYQSRVNDFFGSVDRQNTKRIFEATVQDWHLKERLNRI